MPPKNIAIVKVHWVDAHSHGIGWLDEDEFNQWLDEPGIMVSVGLLLHRGKKWIALSMSVGLDAVSDCLKIPIGMVKKVERLGTVTAKDMAGLHPGGRKRCHQSFVLTNSRSDRSSRSHLMASQSSSAPVASKLPKAKKRPSATRCSARTATR
jgi:hypothetical protein